MKRENMRMVQAKIKNFLHRKLFSISLPRLRQYRQGNSVSGIKYERLVWHK